MVYKMGLMYTLFTVNVIFSFLHVNAQDPIVDTKYGSVRGVAIELQSGAIINSFLGIPYARPPVGDLRFEAPEEPDPWDETLDALEPGDACFQPSMLSLGITHAGWDRFSEDCLHVNIFSPQDASNLPVLVFFHGGAFQEGANFQYPGYFLAERDIVYVSVNYRLAVLGFAFTGDTTISANAGLRDDIMALTFVQENIAAFGGDPNRVVIAGQSAGGATVGLLLLSPLASGLFHAAIPQSGTEFNYWAMNLPETNPEMYLSLVAATLDCPTDDNTAMIQCLRTIDAQELVNTTFTCTEGAICVGFVPVVDGEVIPDRPVIMRNTGQYNKVPEIIGITADENDLLVPIYFPSSGTEGVNRTDFDEFLRESADFLSPAWPDPSRSEDVFRAFQFFYADWPYYDDPFSNRKMVGELLADVAFGYPMDMHAKYHSEDLPVYQYIYDYKMSNSPWPDPIGAFHGSDLSALFGWPFMDDNEDVKNHFQPNPYLNTTGDYSDSDKDIASFMITLWTNFVKFSNPTPEAIEGPGNSTILWPTFSVSDETLNYLYFSDTGVPELNIDYRQKEYAFYTEYINYLVYGNNQTLSG